MYVLSLYIIVLSSQFQYPLVFLVCLFSLLFHSSPSEVRGGSWQVTRVVKPDELGKPDERLRDQMRKLQLSPTPKSTPPTVRE